MGDMDRIVDTEANSQDDVDSRDDVNGDIPEMEEANNIHQGGSNHGKDKDDNKDVTEEESGDDGDAQDGEEQVPGELLSDDLICFPSRIDLTVGEQVWRLGRDDSITDCDLGWYMFIKTTEVVVFNFTLGCCNIWCRFSAF